MIKIIRLAAAITNKLFITWLQISEISRGSYYDSYIQGAYW